MRSFRSWQREFGQYEKEIERYLKDFQDEIGMRFDRRGVWSQDLVFDSARCWKYALLNLASKPGVK